YIIYSIILVENLSMQTQKFLFLLFLVLIVLGCMQRPPSRDVKNMEEKKVEKILLLEKELEIYENLEESKECEKFSPELRQKPNLSPLMPNE
ncbi:MAG: hypothetical protein JW928_04870, partial [Candidatus Aureabacteria bacterium]|nr:hypothetical protein [Candidatus Auribacterota bacterium]